MSLFSKSGKRACCVKEQCNDSDCEKNNGSIDKDLSFEIDLSKSTAESKDLKLNLQIKDSSKKMFLSGEWDATSTLLENENLIENKFNELPYIKFNAH